jgi:hypothetical protein
MHPLTPHMRRVSNQITRQIAMRYGDRFPMYSLSEYPKSGGTWLGRMVSDVLRIPFPRHTSLPLAMTCVVHGHWTYHPRLRGRAIYLYRDGRDAMTSLYFHRMRWLRSGTADDNRRLRALKSLFGESFDPDDSRRYMAGFIEHEFTNPRSSRVTWRDHVMEWFGPGERGKGRDGVVYVSYEQLREDCAGALARICTELTGKAPDSWLVATTVEKWSMERETGRKPGQEDRSVLVRKGIVGDWKNHFTREAAEVFDTLAGDALVRLGYEPDRAWAQRHERAEVAPA